MKNKILFAIFLTLLFLLLPVTNATVLTQKNVNSNIENTKTVSVTFFHQDGTIETRRFNFSKTELEEIKELIVNIMQKIQSNDNENIIDIIKQFSEKYNDRSLLREILNSFIKMRPLKKRAFIISYGCSGRLNIPWKADLRLFKSLTIWHYYGQSKFLNQSKYLNSSKTIIVDPFPPVIRTLEGWQVGMMRRFVGLYIYASGSLFEKRHTFFMGYAYKVRAIDLPEPFQPLINRLKNLDIVTQKFI